MVKTVKSPNKGAVAKGGQVTDGVPKLLPSSFMLTANTLSMMRQNWRLLGGITAVYVLLNILFVTGLSNIPLLIDGLQSTLDASEGGRTASIFEGWNYVLNSNSSNTDAAAALQSILLVIQSLVIIWVIRHLIAGKSVGLKQSYYNSMQPLIPFVLIVGLLILQLLPFSLCVALMALLATAGNGWVTATAIALVIAVAILTIRLMSGTIIALYIVTLPGTLPRQALRSARQLILKNRLIVLRRQLFLPIFLLIVTAAVLLPIIALLPVAAVPVFYVLTAALVVYAHTYLYTLYRSMVG